MTGTTPFSASSKSSQVNSPSNMATFKLVMRSSALALALLLGGCGEDVEKIQEMWRGAVLVKICPDGTYIFRLHDGRFRTGGFGDWVENPDTVCDVQVKQR